MFVLAPIRRLNELTHTTIIIIIIIITIIVIIIIIIIVVQIWFIPDFMSPLYRDGSSLMGILCISLQVLQLEGWVSVRSKARQSRQITSAKVFLGWLWPWTLMGLSFWTFFSQPQLCFTWPCQQVNRCRVPLPDRQAASSPGDVASWPGPCKQCRTKKIAT